jgi:hypothetical protein
MQLTRFYKNTDGADLRVDSITMVERKGPVSMVVTDGRTYIREIKTTLFYGVADREITDIEVIGDFDSIETSSGSYSWASWERPSLDVDLSDLPYVGETI